ncbi:MAG: hypothetical protein A3D18_05005 [Chlamydiae bacterium RIFCSPHIGHO2_02_FULL_49_29]|nr:MAG: hypothetical protein A3D18_05005 [Chlamydiae bacterium RIFCSPHIGHO2_02_FULL_49_29]
MIFTNSRVNVGTAISFTASSTDIVINSNGTYEITYGVSLDTTDTAFELQLDSSTTIADSKMGIKDTRNLYTNSVLVTITAPQTLTLRNVSGKTVVLDSDSAGAVLAFVVIIKLKS